MSLNTVAFSISVVGEVSNETFKGNFVAKVRLSHMDRLRADSLRREYLGPNVEIDQNGNIKNVSPDAQILAVALSQCRVRLVEVPKWWTETNLGADLEDWNVLKMVWESALKVEEDAKASIVKAGEAAAEKLATPSSIKPI